MSGFFDRDSSAGSSPEELTEWDDFTGDEWGNEPSSGSGGSRRSRRWRGRRRSLESSGGVFDDDLPVLDEDHSVSRSGHGSGSSSGDSGDDFFGSSGPSGGLFDALMGGDNDSGEPGDGPSGRRGGRRKVRREEPVSDDPLVDAMNPDAEREVSAGDLPWYRRPRVLAVVAVPVLVGVVAAAVHFGSGVDNETNSSPGAVSTVTDDSGIVDDDAVVRSESSVTSESVVPTEEGTSETVGDAVSSDGLTGSHATGTDAIIAFDTAYYSDRDADMAFLFNSPRNKTTKASLEEAISSGVPADTEFSAEVTPKVIGKTYAVKLMLKFPGKKTMTYNQVVGVERIGGKFYVSSIDMEG